MRLLILVLILEPTLSATLPPGFSFNREPNCSSAREPTCPSFTGNWALATDERNKRVPVMVREPTDMDLLSNMIATSLQDNRLDPSLNAL